MIRNDNSLRNQAVLIAAIIGLSIGSLFVFNLVPTRYFLGVAWWMWAALLVHFVLLGLTAALLEVRLPGDRTERVID